MLILFIMKILFREINVSTIYYKLDQSWAILTDMFFFHRVESCFPCSKLYFFNSHVPKMTKWYGTKRVGWAPAKSIAEPRHSQMYS
jgi:hypothetical protein